MYFSCNFSFHFSFIYCIHLLYEVVLIKLIVKLWVFTPCREAPRELIKNARGGEVNINMEDHKDEEYVRPKVAMKAFSGAGHMLGR